MAHRAREDLADVTQRFFHFFFSTQAFDTSLHKQNFISQHRERAKMEPRSTARNPFIKFSCCTICYTPRPATETIALECGCSHCADCLALQFSTQLTQLDKGLRFGLATQHQPACCRKPIPIEKVVHLLPKALVKSTLSRSAEINSRDRTYCYGESCNTFIESHSIHNGQGFCQNCRRTTCVKCKGKWHFGSCNHGEDFEKLLALAENKRWRSCPACHNAVSRIDGCEFIM